MKRSGFSRPPPKPAKQMDGYTPRPRTPALRMDDGKARMSVPVPKLKPARNEAYRRLVSALPCAHCGRPGPSQCAHSDSAGKGMGIKSCDMETMPLCGPSTNENGCHWLIGTSGKFSKAERRALEARYVDNTKRILLGENSEKS